MQIIQISTCSSKEYGENIYGLGDNGKLYYWAIGRAYIPASREESEKQEIKAGWIEMKDERENS